MLALLMLACIPTVFCVSGDWVEVASFNGTIWPESTEHFMIDYFDWRINWSYTPILSDSIDPHIFRLDVKNASGYVVEFLFVSNKISGTVNMNQTGEYYLYIDPLHAESYSITVEQNTQSIPEPEANWVEVLTLSGQGTTFGDSSPFWIEHVEWRIKWEYTTLPDWDWDNDFSFQVDPHDGGYPIASVSPSDEKNGTLYIGYRTGEFHLSFPPNGIKNWTVIVEQNTNSPIKTENWVQVATLAGQGGVSSTDTFIVEHNDWRILWEVELDNETEWPLLQAYILLQTEFEGSEQRVGSIQMFVNEQTSGILKVYNQTGTFYVDVDASIKNYTIIVEQNVNSIPEFPPALILSFFCGVCLAIVVVKKRWKEGL